jgi:3-phosphoglycerate kinase
LPLKNSRLAPVINVFDKNYANTFNYYPVLRHPEIMKSSAATSYFSPNVEEVDNVEYSDYESETIAPALENFESEKIIKKPSEIKKIITTDVGISTSTSSGGLELFNNTHTYPHISSDTEMADISTQSASNYSKLLFSSPSATVTSNGPSVSH